MGQGQTTPSGQAQPSGTMGQGQTTPSGQAQPSGTMGQGQTTPSGQAQTSPSGTSTNLTVQLTTEQRTHIRQTVLVGRDVPRMSNVDFTIRVGTRVPREKVRLVAVPDELIRINPRFRGLEYIVVGDQILVIDPRTLEIVAIIDV
jgi:hypothetical protein